jgi:hypothetical protein
LILLAGISKNTDWQINYGTGKNVKKGAIPDSRRLLEIKWYNDSYSEIPVYKD